MSVRKPPARKTAPPARKTAVKKVAKRRAAVKKAAVKKCGQTKKVAKKRATRKPPGGKSTTTTQKNSSSGRSTFPPNAIVALSDAEHGAAVLDALKARFTADRIADEFDELLKAAYENKHGEQKADDRTRLATLEKVVHLTVGKPLDRVQHVETTVFSYDEIEELIKHSKSLRLALREMLAEFDEEDSASEP